MAAKCCCLTQQLLISTSKLRNVFILQFLHYKSTPSKDEDEPPFFSFLVQLPFTFVLKIVEAIQGLRSQVIHVGKETRKVQSLDSFEMLTSPCKARAYYHQTILLVEVIMVLSL